VRLIKFDASARFEILDDSNGRSRSGPGAQTPNASNVLGVGDRWKGTLWFLRDVAVAVVAGSAVLYVLPKAFGLTVPVWAWAAVGGIIAGAVVVLGVNRFKGDRRELGRWACGCSTDKAGDYLCGRCHDHCQCAFDEMGSPRPVPKP
jgi:hypothetical protein